ncbi:MAG: cytochrome P450 [Nocardioides sp.]
MTDVDQATAVPDLADPGAFDHGIPHERFAQLRHESPVSKQPFKGGQDYWAVTRYDDIVTVNRDYKTYSNALGFTTLEDLTEESMKVRRSIIETDPPAHMRLRKLAMPPFTLRKVGDYVDQTAAIAGRLLDAACDQGEVDFVRAVSAPFPMQVFTTILGVPEEDSDYMIELSDHLVEGMENTLAPDAYGNTTPLELLPFRSPAAHALFEYGRELGEQRRADPKPDLISAIVNADLDGDRLSEVEYANFFQVLVFAGNETTRTAISNGIDAFARFPEQLEKLHADPELVESAVEEIIRWATPVLYMRRTAAVDTELAGVPIAAGDKVVMWYCSANYDETVFEDPLEFRIDRPVRPKHLAFGAQGPHQCLGASLARLEIKVLLQEILKRGLRFEPTGEALRTRSSFVNGISTLPLRITAG